MRHPIITEDLHEISNYRLPFEKLTGKTILVAGASGMIGGCLVEFLLYLNETRNSKIKVIALTRNEKKTKKKFSHYAKRRDLSLIIQDVIAPLKIKEKINYVIHAASQSSPKYFGIDPVGTLLPNVIGTKNLLEIAQIKKAEFLFISSGEIYGFIDKNIHSIKEEDVGRVDTLDVRSCYAESKRLAETMCISYYMQYGVETKIVRPFHVYGPGMDLTDGRVFADFVRNIVKRENLAVLSRGTAKRSFCYLTDAITAFLTVILSGNVGSAYNVGNNKEEVSIKELANRLIKLFPEKKLKVVFKKRPNDNGYLPSGIKYSCPNLSRIHRLGWYPKHTIESGFKRTVLSFS